MNAGPFYVYLAGPIMGQFPDRAVAWRNYIERHMPPEIICLSPLRHKRFDCAGRIADPANGHLLYSDRGITSRDRFDVTRATIGIWNFLESPEKATVGSLIELGWADMGRTIKIVIMREGNIHDHPMVRDLADYIVRDLDGAIGMVKAILLPETGGLSCPTSPAR